MGFNDKSAKKLKPKSRPLMGASMPSKHPGDPRQYRAPAALMDERFLGEGLRMDQDGRIAIDFSLVERRLPPYIHEKVVVFNAAGDVDSIDDNQPAAARLLFNASRSVTYEDLSLYRQVQLRVRRGNAAAAAGTPFVELRYSIIDSVTVGDFVQVGAAPVRVTITPTQVTLLTDWIDLEPAARAPVYLAPVTEGGDGAADPNYGEISAHFRR